MSKKMNEYAREVPHYDDIPKSVLAALAFSLAMRLEVDDVGGAKALLIVEWINLHKVGIVPQPVPSKFHDFLIPYDFRDRSNDEVKP